MRTAARRATRLLALGAGLAAASSSLTACDASAYAANVNGHEISQNTLNSELKVWASNPTLVSLANQQISQTLATVHGTGGDATYSTPFASYVLTTVIRDQILRQRLSGTGRGPDGPSLTAARALLEANFNPQQGISSWDSLPESVRELFVRLTAEEGLLEGATATPEQVKQELTSVAPYFFDSVCVVVASTFSPADAQAIITSGQVTGAPVCYDQVQFESQAPAFQSAVVGLSRPGQISDAVKTAFGYQVVQLTRRTVPPTTDDVTKVVSAIVAQGSGSELARVITSARVTINPMYGSWSSSQGQVQPPAGPPNS